MYESKVETTLLRAGADLRSAADCLGCSSKVPRSGYSTPEWYRYPTLPTCKQCVKRKKKEAKSAAKKSAADESSTAVPHPSVACSTAAAAFRQPGIDGSWVTVMLANGRTLTGTARPWMEQHLTTRRGLSMERSIKILTDGDGVELIACDEVSSLTLGDTSWPSVLLEQANNADAGGTGGGWEDLQGEPDTSEALAPAGALYCIDCGEAEVAEQNMRCQECGSCYGAVVKGGDPEPLFY